MLKDIGFWLLGVTRLGGKLSSVERATCPHQLIVWTDKAIKTGRS